MTTFLDALADLVGLTDPHIDEYQGRTYTTPALTTDHDDGKENPHPHGNHANPIPQA